MAKDYIPGPDSQLVTFAQNYSTVVTAAPTSLSLTTTQATALAAAVTLFVNAYNVVHNGSTRSPANIVLKDEARAALVRMLRQLTGIIQKSPIVTNSQREQLRITVPVQPAPIPPPALAPSVDITGVVGHTVKCKVHRTDGSRRGKPAGVASAFIYSYVGTTAPTDPSLYKFEGSTTRTTFDVVFPISVAGGAQVFITAMWANPRNECGPACEPVGTYLQGAATLAA